MLEITRIQLEHIQEIARQYELKLLVLFGSQVTGKTHAESDYDIAYAGREKLSLDQEGRLIVALTGCLGLSDERLLNLVPIARTNPLLLYAITDNARVLYESESGIFAGMRAFAFKQYVELKPLYEAKFRRLGNIIKSYDI